VTSRRYWVAAQAVITIVLVAALVYRLDLAAFRALFARLPAWFYALSLFVILAGQVAYAWRWRLLLTAAGVNAPFTVVVRQQFVGIFANNFLPSTVGGDLAKVYLLGRDHGYRAVTASVVLDRLLGLALLALLASIILWALPMPSRILEAARGTVTSIAGVALVALALTALDTRGLAGRVGWMGSAAVAAAHRLHGLRADMAAGLNPAIVAQAAGVVVGYWAGVAGIYVIFVTILIGRSPSLVMMCGVVTAISVLSAIPVSLNGVGLREQLHVVLLAPLGIDRELAAAISLLLFGHLLVASLLGFFFWMRSPARRRDGTRPPPA
jgi:uncharacterized protein (TIRG00374 family)